ncbi:MAG: histidine phosphatase family protein [Lachnospiraceae bacterium]|nr:histidine phosphatase family protein [Lachnospiraceae bacterium]
MKIIIVRHADPDYSIDSLTPVGWKEAELLSNRLVNVDVDQYYVSPLGRAKDTASLTLKKCNRTAVECQWLREFACRIARPDKEQPGITWDWLPQDWTKVPEYYDAEKWCTTDIMKAGNVDQEYAWVTSELDKLLEKHGYVRENRYYRAVKPNNDTIMLFCHFGLECVLLSHLLNISPMVLWHGTCAAPSSVTTVVTEERRKGIAVFRMLSFGDTSHLYAAGEKPSFAARFCEAYDNADERHD